MGLRRTRDPGVSGERVLVELVESDDACAGPHGPGRPGAPGAPDLPGEPADEAGAPPAGLRRRRRPLWWVGAAVLAVLALVATVANVAEARRAADRRAALAEQPWILPALDGPLEEVWRIPGLSVVDMVPGVLVVNDDANGLRGVDPASGADLWAIRVEEGEYCGSIGWPWPYQQLDVASEGSGSPILLCQQTSSLAEGEVSSASAIRTVDAGTGKVLAHLSVEGSLITMGLVGAEDLVTVGQWADDTVVVQRVSLRTGLVSWRYASEPGAFSRLFGNSFRFDIGETSVVVGTAPGLVLSLATGEVLPAEESAADPEPILRRTYADGSELRWWSSSAASPDGSGQVVDADGAVRFTFEGYFGGALASDAAPGAVMVRGSGSNGALTRLTALDLSTGDELWTGSRDDAANALLELDGDLLIVGGTASLIDERTGETRWEHPAIPSVVTYLPVTDGGVVVLPVAGDGAQGGAQLVALDLGTGEERWRMPAPDGLSTLTSAGNGLVLVFTMSEVIAYRP